MKKTATLLAALAVTFAAKAAIVRTATETFVTNKIAAAVAAIPAPDFSTDNAALVETIEATAPTPGDYVTVSNRAMSAVQPLGAYALCLFSVGGDTLAEEKRCERSNFADSLFFTVEYDDALYRVFFSQGEWWLLSGGHGTIKGAVSGYDIFSDDQFITFRNPDLSELCAFHAYVSIVARLGDIPDWARATTKPTYTASEVGATTPEDVNNAIREQSLGGIWDETLQVWWTPRMRGGSLTYEATTNVNLSTEN